MKHLKKILAFMIFFFVLFDHATSYLNYEHEINPFANYFIKNLGLGPYYFVLAFFVFLGLYFLIIKFGGNFLSKYGIDGEEVFLSAIVIALSPNFLHTLLMYFGIYFPWKFEWNLVFIFIVIFSLGSYKIWKSRKKTLK